MSVIKMYGPASAGAEVTVSIDVPADGILDSLSLGVTVDDDTAMDGAPKSLSAEVSFMSSSTFVTNDARGSLCTVTAAMFGQVVTDLIMLGPTSVPFCILNNLNIRLNAGERIYMHILSSDPDIPGRAAAYLFINDNVDGRARTRRR